MENGTSNGAVYLQTNDAARNEIVAYRRRADGSLARHSKRTVLSWRAGETKPKGMLH